MGFARGVIVSLILLFLVPLASADTDVLDRQATSLNDRIMSPYCPAVTLSACTSPNAKSLRNSIRGWLEEGQSVEQIENKLIEDFGSGVLGTPTKYGFGLVGWVMPFVVFLLGGVVIFRIIKKSKSKATPVEESTEGVAEDSDLRERIEREIKERMLGR